MNWSAHAFFCVKTSENLTPTLPGCVRVFEVQERFVRKKERGEPLVEGQCVRVPNYEQFKLYATALSFYFDAK